jgi:hypothetical protein
MHYNPSPLYGNPKKELRKRAFPGKYGTHVKYLWKLYKKKDITKTTVY